MSAKEKTAKLPKKAGGSPAKPAMLTKIVAALIKSELKERVMKTKGMAIVPSISNWIEAKWVDKPAKHLLRSSVERGIQNGVLQRPNNARTGLNGSIKIHPKFAKLLADRGTSGDNPKEVANAIAAFNKRSPSPEPEAPKPKKKAAAATVKKPKADFPVAKKKPTAGAGTGKKRLAKAQEDEPKAKKAKK
ncbi:hypothetical protein CpipJ_CPIJ010439 [Culex quinquefasciatus]|uniref:H15 domain-containing protein n=1 Tax=Culex quinquefasciatus TaxID=7176 RepID=B0WT19_CULQU|nr:histone H1.0 [Culex quinquefasciatus]EDS34156.1 hypothetical protein CpipJ_CPIJ010439 [Culex quinquefasciatus]|eukprot:XP_001870781.1 hypothetical protein CpipJ_CPIJ010439 [Culex quinquefasciatus]